MGQVALFHYIKSSRLCASKEAGLLEAAGAHSLCSLSGSGSRPYLRLPLRRAQQLGRRPPPLTALANLGPKDQAEGLEPSHLVLFIISDTWLPFPYT